MFLTNVAFRKQNGNSAPVLVWLNLNSKDEVNELHDLWSRSQAKIVSPPESKPWGLHEFTVADIDGNLFRVFYDCVGPARWPDKAGEGPVVEIHDEDPNDYPEIRELNEKAFGGPAEAKLVDMLRAAKKLVISLVAVHQSRVVGHISFSPVTVAEAPANVRAVGLAPMSVLPEFQNQGIGSKLVREGLEACKRAGYDVVVVLGHTKFYPRFGFVRAKDFGLDSEYNSIESFMVLELRNGVLQEIGGLVKYSPEFRDAGC
jgi:putative acetyltransferase